jgi:hypothetical protein
VLAQVRRLSIISEWLPHAGSIDSSGSPQAKRIHQKWSRILYNLEGVPLGDISIPQVGNYSRIGWTPVVNLIRQAPFLKHVNIFFQDGGPVELFKSLSRYHPACRVSILTACKLLGVDPTYSGIPETWANLPMLHAVHITCLGQPNPSTQEFIEHPDGSLQSIALRASNIKHIVMQINSTWGYLPGLKEIIQAKSGAQNEKPTGPTKLKTISWPLSSKITVE